MHRLLPLVLTSLLLSGVACGDDAIEPEPNLPGTPTDGPTTGNEPEPEPMPTPQPEPTPDPEPSLGFGSPCEASSQCLSGLCLSDRPGANSGRCSEFCDLDSTAWCNDRDMFCVPLDSGGGGCSGEIEGGLGLDGDTAVLESGDQKTRGLDTLDDVDLYRLDFFRDGKFIFSAEPTSDQLDLQVELYDELGQKLFEADSRGPGGEEAGILTMGGPGHAWLVVRNVGRTTAPYVVGMVFDSRLLGTSPVALEGAPHLPAAPFLTHATAASTLLSVEPLSR